MSFPCVTASDSKAEPTDKRLQGVGLAVPLRRALDRVWIAYLYLYCVSLHLITPFLRCNGLVPALVAVEVESHERRGVRRDWRRDEL
ncbi:MAG: hypothetical protein JRG93_16435 [Deltaproteobacteria bacterium]|nr:hypothetical protein [Deltaproteobacteria bacterium]